MPVRNVVVGQNIASEKQQRAKQMRREPTSAEDELWKRLRGNRLNGLHFRRQQVIDGFVVDFYCHAHALIVEVDGSIHASQVEEDALRERHLRERGFRMLRFSNEDVICHPEIVLLAIWNACV